MEITWLGHSSVCLNSRDVILITDPYDTSDGNSMSPQKADIVTISNKGEKYSTLSSIIGNPQVIDGPGEYEMSHFYVTGTGTPLGDPDDIGGEINTVYTIRAEGLVLCQIGALNQRLTPAQLDRLTQTQILIVPISGKSAPQISFLQDIISAVQPRILLPVQHGTNELEGLEEPARFLAEIGVTDVTNPTNRLNVSETNLPGEMRVNLLNRQ